MKKTIKTGHSSYWLDEDLWYDGDVDSGVVKNDISKVVRLATVRRAISNFVSILSGKNVPVRFQGEDSYTDGNEVVIAADDNPNNFDVTVGLALHEASHILLSDFRWLKLVTTIGNNIPYGSGYTHYYQLANGTEVTISPPTGESILSSILRPEILDAIDKSFKALNVGGGSDTTYYYGKVAQEYLRHTKTICNILEDRRIDQYIYNNAMGYRPYYSALYDKYFYTKEASKFIRLDPDARLPTVENYINHMLYQIHPDSDPDALPGLKAIFKEMDLPNIHLVGPENDPPIGIDAPGNGGRNYAVFTKPTITLTYEQTPRLWQKANDILAMIVKFVDLYVEFSNNGNGKEDSQNVQGEHSGGGESTSSTYDESENDPEIPTQPSHMAPRAPQAPKTSREAPNQTRAEKERDKIKDFLNGDLKKKKITKALAASVKAMEEAKGEVVDVSLGGTTKVKCMVTKNITEALLKEDWFIFSSGMNETYYNDSQMMEAILAGRRMGEILHHRLQIRNDPMTTRQTRLSSGKIERRLLANLGFDGTDVFYRTRTDQHKPVMLHLTIDASGSMDGRKFRRAMTVATAIAYLSDKMNNVECAISLRGGDNIPIIAVVFDSRRDPFRKWMKFAPHLYASGNTPEGLCFAAITDLILDSKNTHDVYFINFSDGMPGFAVNDNANIVSKGSYGGSWYQEQFAFNHTRKMVNHLRDNGVKILSYFIEDNYGWYPTVKNNFKYMYGEDAEFVDVTSVTNVLSTLNKRLAKR